jgi:flagellar operon protein (TIGR03826 family)
MADFINCDKCGRMFQTIAGVKLCGRCRESDDDMFKVVREYVYDNPGATVPEVSEATDVPEKKILKFLRDGRLETKGDSMLIDCERCGTAIPSGRYCNACTKEMSQGLRDMAKKMKADLEPQSKDQKSVGKGMYTQHKKPY